MKSIMINVPELLNKVREISEDGMTFVRLSIINETTDQSLYSPSFLHFEAYSGDGYANDYESIDKADYCYIEKRSS